MDFGHEARNDEMFQAYGLYGHIQANRIRSVILLAGFVVLLQALMFSFNLIWSALAYGGTLLCDAALTPLEPRAVATSDLEGDVVGLAMSHTDIDPVSGAHVRVSGLVFLDTDLRRYPRDPTGQPAWVSVLHHELGHLVGLDHVTDESQLMHPQDSGTHVSYEDGDRAGLAELGRGTCAPGV